MSQRDMQLLLLDMRDYADQACVFMQGRVRADLDTDRMLELALVRALEIIGGATSQIPRDQQAMHPDIP